MNTIRRVIELLNEEHTSFLPWQPTMHSMPLVFRSWRLLMCMQASAVEPYDHVQDRPKSAPWYVSSTVGQ